MRRFVLALLFFAATASIARAEPGETLHVYVITIERGDEVFEKFAHNVIWIHDDAAPKGEQDVIYNWGVFDFSQTGFYVKYMHGRMDYMTTAEPLPQTVAWYTGHNRSMWAQELNLKPAQRLKVFAACEQNVLPENSTYRYNYYTDNCSTRVRDMVDLATGGALKAQLAPQMTDKSFRWHTRRLLRDDWIWYSMLNTVLGPAIDRPISQWDECFLPMRLRDYLRTAKNAAGEPLVINEHTIFQGTRPPDPTEPPGWSRVVWYFITGLAVGAAIEAARRWGGRITFGIVLTLVTFLVGLCGLLGVYAWLFTDHWAAWRNQNLFGYSPLAMPIAFLVPPFIRRRERVTKIVMKLAYAIVALNVLGIVLAPLLPQHIAEPMALIFPINLAVAFSTRQYLAKPSPTTQSPP